MRLIEQIGTNNVWRRAVPRGENLPGFPDWSLFVESGAMEPELARMLDEARQKWAAAGRAPTVEPMLKKKGLLTEAA